MTKEEFYSRALNFDEVGEQVDIFKRGEIRIMDYIDIMKKDRELCLSDNIKEIEKKFEPCTECKECYFCSKPNYDFLPKICILYANKIKDNQAGCLGGYKKKEVSE